MKYLWTEDSGAGYHFWQLANKYLFQGILVVESKGSNQGLLDAVRALKPEKGDIYYLAFDMVYDNMDVVNKMLELQELSLKYPKQIMMLDIICFEYIIFTFYKLIEWTGCGRKDTISIRENLLPAIQNHRVNLDSITDDKTRNYLMGFKRFSTERVIKSMTNLLTDSDAWSVNGDSMGNCWHKDCCVLEGKNKKKCSLDEMSGMEKMMELLTDTEMQRIVSVIR